MNIHFDIERAKNEIRQLLNAYPELSDDDVLRADMIEAETKFQDVIDHLLRMTREAVVMSNAIEDEVNRLTERQGRYEMRNAKLRGLIHKMMDVAGEKKIERPLGTVSVAVGKPKVIITNEAILPDRFVRIKREPDKTSIGLALKAGESVSGATLSNAEAHLRIS
jgi:hypothetical protein